MLAVCNVKDYDKSTKLLASTTLRFVYKFTKIVNLFYVKSTVCLFTFPGRYWEPRV